MTVLNRERIAALYADIERAADLRPAIAQIKETIEIKSAHLWRAEAGSCCFGPEVARCIDAELQILENTLQCLEREDRAGGIELLREYERLLT